MAKKSNNLQDFNKLKKSIENKEISAFYLLMGDEPYYVDILSELIIEHTLSPEEVGFNQTILYGNDTNTNDIITTCSRYPMMAERQLVIIKEAQNLKKIDELSLYLENLVPTTVLVVCYTGKSADKRTSFYKNATKHGVVFESSRIRQEAIPAWIEAECKSLGKRIEPAAAVLLAEYAGVELRKLALEIDKLINACVNNPVITSLDIEKNIGISREINISELTNALANKDAKKAHRIAYFIGESPKKYPIQMTLGFLFFFFSKIGLIQAYIRENNMSISEATSKAGIYSSYSSPYIAALKTYPYRKTMKIISLIKECDYKSKSNLRGDATDSDLLIEFITKVLFLANR